jgi:Tol biopolymer transport system component
VKSGGIAVLVGLAVVLILGPSSVAAGTAQPLIVSLQCCGEGFAFQTLDGTVVATVPIPAGAGPSYFSAAANESIVYDDASGGDGNANGNADGPVWLVASGQSPVELDSSPHDFGASISYDGSKVTFARFDPITDSSDIYVVDADGSGLKLVAAGGGNNNLSSPEFSPDGGSIAYVCGPASNGLGMGIGCGPTPGGRYRSDGVMLMNADGSDKRMILGADPYSIAWSPDGQSLAMSGCVTKVVNDVWSCGLSQIFVYRTDGSDLFNDGAAARQVTHETVEEAVGDAQFTSGGSQIVFSKVLPNANASTLWEIDNNGTNEHELSAQPYAFHLVPLATGGGPSPTVNVSQWTGPGVGPIVMLSENGDPIEQCRGYLTETASGAFSTCASIPPDAEGVVPSAASDGSVVYNNDIVTSVGGQGPVWLVAPGKSAVELDSSPEDENASISWDGSKVTFDRLDPATKSTSIYVVNSNGSGLKRVASGQVLQALEYPRFSPDGGSIAYSDGGDEWLMNADGSDQRMIVKEISGPASWSPDGRWLAMANSIGSDGNAEQVFAYHTDGSDLYDALDAARQITHVAPNPSVPFVAVSDPQFSADGNQVYFGESVDANGVQGIFGYVANRDGTDERQVPLTPDDALACPAGDCIGNRQWGFLVPPAGGEGAPPTVKPTQATVPNVRTLRYRTARKRLAAVHLAAKVTHRSYSTRIARGHVISQHPRARAQARLTKRHRTPVKLILSRGKRPKRH